MKLFAWLVLLTLLPGWHTGMAQQRPDYLAYHRQTIVVEELVAQRRYAAALAAYEPLFASYDYVFLRDCKVATQLALYVGDSAAAYRTLRRGVLGGWTLPEIKKSRFLKPLRTGRQWAALQAQYNTLRSTYEQKLQQPLRAEVLRMGREDQKLAFRNLLKLSQRARNRFLEKRFTPNSERQVAQLTQILPAYGYPGEKLIGNRACASRILSHHNSISTAYTRQDTLYPRLRPQLLAALRRGELAPGDYAVMEDWYVTIKSDRQEAAYGYLNSLTTAELAHANELRQQIGLRSVELRNQLIDVQAQTGMDLHLDGVFWVAGKLPVVAHR